MECRKIPAQWWPESWATCSLGMCHGSHMQTGMEFYLHNLTNIYINDPVIAICSYTACCFHAVNSCTVRKDILEYMKLKFPMILCHTILTFVSVSGVCVPPDLLQMSLPSASLLLYLKYVSTPLQISNYICTNVATKRFMKSSTVVFT